MQQNNTFEKCLQFETKTSKITIYALELFGFTQITPIDYNSTISQSLQNKWVDFIGSMLWYRDIWIDAKVRAFTGYNYTDIAIEEKSLDYIQKRNDCMLYITPNKDHIACHLIDLNILRKEIGNIKPLSVKIGVKNKNETIMIYSFENLRKKNILTSLTVSYRLFEKDIFLK